MKKLEKLDLSWNRFDEMLPTCLSNLKSLRELDLSFNQFTGSVSSSLISNLTSLEYIHLGYNHFTGLFSFSSFANHSKLEVVGLPSNNDNFKVLVLSRCNLNKLTGDIPKFLSHQAYLLQVDLSHNNLKGDLPNWMLENNRRQRIPWPYILNTILPAFATSAAFGQQPVYRNSIRRTLELLVVDFLGYQKQLFLGEIPKWINGMTSLRTLIMRNNSFHGRILTNSLMYSM
ncbi:hypothetical protein AAG906_032879 [Vitis piasezkii]